MTIEFKQFDNIRFVVFGKFCFEETKRSHTKTRNEKRRKKLVKNLKKSFSISKYLETFFLFLYFKPKRNKTKFFFRGAIKNELFNHKTKQNVDIPSWHSLAQRKLSPLNILLTINGLLLS